MKLARALLVTCFLWLGAVPALAVADVPTPKPAASLAGPQPTAPPGDVPTVGVEPTTAPVASPAPVTSPEPDTSPVVVKQEHPQPPTVSPYTPPATAGPAPLPTAAPVASSQPGGSSSTSPASSSSGYAGVTGSPDVSQFTNVSSGPGGYAAPAQLKCTDRKYPISGPFLQSPYGGWASINSFLDHDSPDYTEDGVIVLANGLTADASNGQESDMFPGYWSPSLRQYVDYDGHNGYDFGISYQPVYAAAAGTVMFAGWNSASQYAGYGQMILIDHHNGYVTLYGHLSSLEVSKGDKVSSGEEIGISGTTGNSSGPHLHFSVFHNCQVTDPYGWTGSGKDPLVAFDGEHAAYLWLPGHDPLVLNTPPNWPSYPLGLKVALPPSVAGRLSPRAVPPVDRLLLLKLPTPRAGERVSPGLALARTEAAMDQELEALTPYLNDLESQGLIESYQAVPAAAAIWVRGTASSEQLEGLPGVASLSGVRPDDLRAGQAGLAHSVLIQLGQQQAPSLWPVGFRSALHAWRPVITAVRGQALVEGFALPGQRVIVSVQRGTNIPAAAEATGDAQTGGFVATLQDAAGRPLAVRAGDIVQVQTGGRNASVVVDGLKVRVHANSVSGQARPGATVPISVFDRGSARLWRMMATADGSGRFSLPVPVHLAAGSLAVASATDGAGDQESAFSYVPGMTIDLSSDTVTGWAVTRAPDLQIWRGGREIDERAVTPSASGIYRVDLARASAHTLLAGDAVSVGSRWHRHRVIVPSLSVHLAVGLPVARIAGPAGAVVTAELSHAGRISDRTVALNGAGQASIPMPGQTAVGDAAAVTLALPSGDTVRASSQVSGVLVHVGSGKVTGQTERNSALSIKLESSRGATLARGATESDAATGSYSVTLRSTSARRFHLEPGMKLLVQDRSGTLQVTIPRLEVRRDPTVSNLRLYADQARVLLTTVTRRGARLTRTLSLPHSGSRVLHLPGASRLRSVVISTVPIDGISFERTVRIYSRSLCSRRPSPTQSCRATPAARSRH